MNSRIAGWIAGARAVSLPAPIARYAPLWRPGRVVALGVALMVAALILTITTLTSTKRADKADNVATTAVAQRNAVASDLQEDATTVTALCATTGDVARALQAAGQCDKAAARLINPVVSGQAPVLSGAQINDIVTRVAAQTGPSAGTVDDVVSRVLARIAADPSLRGITEAQVRAIVAAAIAANPSPPGRNGTSFGGLTFTRRDGTCVALVTTVGADGATSTAAVPVGDGACSPTPAPTGAPSSDPSPPSTVAPAPPADPAPTVAPEPTTADVPPTTTDNAPPADEPPADGGLLGGLID